MKFPCLFRMSFTIIKLKYLSDVRLTELESPSLDCLRSKVEDLFGVKSFSLSWCKLLPDFSDSCFYFFLLQFLMAINFF